jgi:hypothetical protein
MRLMPAEFAVSHPEFYPMRNGARYIPPAGVVTGWQPCYPTLLPSGLVMSEN